MFIRRWTRMNDPLVLALVGVVGILLGVVLAWGLNLLQDWLHQRQVRHRVRLLLRLECKRNVAALIEFWGFVSRDGVYLPDKGWLVSVGPSFSEAEYDKRQRLAVWPLPVWGRHMWESQAGLLPDALNEDEIARVYAMYSDLETFTARRAEMQAQFATPEGEELAKHYGVWMQGKHQGTFVGEDEAHMDSALRNLNTTTVALWSECEAVYNRVLPYKDSDIITP
jgi:hypothetical protein